MELPAVEVAAVRAHGGVFRLAKASHRTRVCGLGRAAVLRPALTYETLADSNHGESHSFEFFTSRTDATSMSIGPRQSKYSLSHPNPAGPSDPEGRCSTVH